jgi:hypothetical protein
MILPQPALTAEMLIPVIITTCRFAHFSTTISAAYIRFGPSDVEFLFRLQPVPLSIQPRYQIIILKPPQQ